VPRNGVVYHVGDFAFADHDPYLRRLNGEKHLVPGNHDHRNRIKRAPLWHTVEDKLTHIEVMGDIQVVLCHYAMRVWRNAHHGALHFYDHSHGNLPGDAQSLDVGVDCWDFAPASFRPNRDAAHGPARAGRVRPPPAEIAGDGASENAAERLLRPVRRRLLAPAAPWRRLKRTWRVTPAGIKAYEQARRAPSTESKTP
jgi:hypothetical protein